MAVQNILDITKIKKSDTICIRYANIGTPSDPLLDIYDIEEIGKLEEYSDKYKVQLKPDSR